MVGKEPVEKELSGVPVPPPIIYLVCLLAGLGLDWLWPIPLIPQTVQYAVGAAIIVSSFALFGFSLREFIRSGTRIEHQKPTTTVVATGPFAYSRNPFYISLTMLLVGIAVAVDSPWVMLMAVPAVLVIHRFVIRREEAFLEHKFGDEYLRYKAAVRRWL